MTPVHDMALPFGKTESALSHTFEGVGMPDVGGGQAEVERVDIGERRDVLDAGAPVEVELVHVGKFVDILNWDNDIFTNVNLNRAIRNV